MKISLSSARLVFLTIVGLTNAGCALTSKSDPVILRYFTPERAMVPSDTPAGAEQHDLELRLGRVNAASYIKDRIAYRDSDHEVGYYDELRWTEKPESYLRRALGRALFEQRGLKQLIAPTGPTLEIELQSFEELRVPRHVARLQVTWLVRDEQSVQIQRTFTIERPIEPSKPEVLPDAIAAAMTDALSEAVKSIVAGTVSELVRDNASAGAVKPAGSAAPPEINAARTR